MYNSRVWLNKIGSPSTGSVVAFDGEVNHWKGDKIREIYLQVSDCSISARLSKTSDDTVEDFIQKMKILREEIDLFINHLETTNQ